MGRTYVERWTDRKFDHHHSDHHFLRPYVTIKCFKESCQVQASFYWLLQLLFTGGKTYKNSIFFSVLLQSLNWIIFLMRVIWLKHASLYQRNFLPMMIFCQRNRAGNINQLCQYVLHSNYACSSKTLNWGSFNVLHWYSIITKTHSMVKL